MFSSATSSSVLSFEQKKEIETQIQALNEAYSKLSENDLKIYVPAMMGLFAWLRSNLGMLESIMMSGVGIYFLNVSFKERAKLVVTFTHELSKLASLYQSASKLGYRVTHEKVFLQALEALAPFIGSTRDLLTKDFFERSADVSSDFIVILSKSPHQLPQLMMTAQSTPSHSYMSKLFAFFAATPERKPLTSIPISTQTIFTSSLASARHYVYGYQTIDQLNQSTNAGPIGLLTRASDQIVAASLQSDLLRGNKY